MSIRQNIIPIKKSVLIWARETSGLTINDVAQKINKSPDLIRKWEEGVALPSLAQLENLAYQIYKRPLALFFLNEPPDDVKYKREFRALREDLIENIPYELRMIIREVKFNQMVLNNLEDEFDDKNKIHKNIKVNIDDNIEHISKYIRNFLNLSFSDQLKLKNPQEAYRFYRELLEKKGIHVFQYPIKVARGFCLFDDSYPLIIVNSKDRYPHSKIFTLFHELSHILLNEGSIFFKEFLEFNTNNVEVFCNKLAASILVPDKLFLDNIEIPITSDKIISLSKSFSVSQEVIYRKLLIHNYISEIEYNNYRNKWDLNSKPKKVNKKLIIPYHTRVISKLGKNYINSVLTNLKKGNIGSSEASEFLKVKINYFNKISESLS